MDRCELIPETWVSYLTGMDPDVLPDSWVMPFLIDG